MNVKEIYNSLTNKTLSLSDFNDIINFKNQCKIEMNQEYLYLADILIIDLYINEGLYDDALEIANKAIHSIDNVVFSKIYVSFIERLIYIFIQKKNFKSAYRYAFMKRNYIDLDNIDEVNRWYLEMAYIYAELNQKDKALMNLKAILNNYPNDALRALTLSNMTKLYIDEKQIEEAKSTLNDCISLVYKLGDEEGILYCNYLNAKLSILEKNFKHAKHSFQDVFKNIHNITDDYLSIANEYVSLLIDMDLYDEAQRMCIRYIKNIEKSDDLEIKKDFYTNYLKVHILKNKNIRDDVRQLLKALEILQKEIDKNEDNIINESNEDEKKIEIEDQLSKLIQKIEKTVNITLISLENDNIRNTLMNYSVQLEEHIRFDEATYVLFPIGSLDIIPEVNDNFSKVITFNYKKGRLYERETSFNNLTNSIVEMIISQNHEIMIDFTDSVLNIKDLITNESYSKAGIKSLIAFPLFNKNELYGVSIYVSKSNQLLENEVMTNLKISTKLLEPKLINIYFEEQIRTLKTINNLLAENIHNGVFYYNPNNEMFTLSDELTDFFKLDNKKMSLSDYENLLSDENKEKRSKVIRHIENVEEYSIEYFVVIDEKTFLIEEKAYPYITREGIVKFYFGVIKVLKDSKELEEDSYEMFNEADFFRDFKNILEHSKEIDYKANFVKFRIDGIEEYNTALQTKIQELVYSSIKKDISLNTYVLNDGDILVIVEGMNSKLLEKNIKDLLNTYDKGIIYDDKVMYFIVRAGLVRFPIDTYNLKEVLQFCDIALTSNERYQPFTDKYHNLYLKRKSIIACVNEHIVKNEIELLYSPLLKDNEVSGYLIHYNINGLDNVDLIEEYLNDTYLISLEKLILNTLLKSNKANVLNKIYLNISSKTLEDLVINNYFKKKDIDLYRGIVFCINDTYRDINKIVNQVEKYEFELILNLDIFDKISLDTLVSKPTIRGVYTNKDLRKEQIYLELFNLLNYEIITNNNIEVNSKTKFISDEIYKFSQLN